MLRSALDSAALTISAMKRGRKTHPMLNALSAGSVRASTTPLRTRAAKPPTNSKDSGVHAGTTCHGNESDMRQDYQHKTELSSQKLTGSGKGNRLVKSNQLRGGGPQAAALILPQFDEHSCELVPGTVDGTMGTASFHTRVQGSSCAPGSEAGDEHADCIGRRRPPHDDGAGESQVSASRQLAVPGRFTVRGETRRLVGSRLFRRRGDEGACSRRVSHA